MPPICPRCGNHVGAANGVAIDIGVAGRSWKGLAYTCIICGAILGCQIDPIAVKTYTVDEVVDALMERLSSKH